MGGIIKLLTEVKDDFKKCRPILCSQVGYGISVLSRLVYKILGIPIKISADDYELIRREEWIL